MLWPAYTVTIQLGSSGPDVRAWQTFLLGEGLFQAEVSGTFDQDTAGATAAFQQLMGLSSDGKVGPKTLAVAQLRGLPQSSPVTTGGALTPAQRAAVFGTFAYRPAGSTADPEAIIITDGWAAKNITSVEIPQLAGVLGAPAHTWVPFHTKAAGQFKALWQAWEDAGLLPLVLSWAGSWAPRFIRGSRTTLSNHAYGTAFDINAAWNGLGKVGPAVGVKGSVRELVPLAEEHGFTWGGSWPTRPDPMHFEVNRLV